METDTKFTFTTEYPVRYCIGCKDQITNANYETLDCGVYLCETCNEKKQQPKP